MATTGELRAIIEELQMVDIGDAASYLGEENVGTEEPMVSVDEATLHASKAVHQPTWTDPYGNCAPLQ
jgi:hypothetical protein